MTLALSSTAMAHVTVKPSEALTASYQTFLVSVPNEKSIPTTSIKVVIPSGVQSVTPTQKAGWQVTTDKTGTGEDATVTAITWSGGTINQGTRDEFSFSAKLPDQATELQWKAYQTYSDGTVVSWDKAGSDDRSHDSEDENSGPLSVTNVVTETGATATVNAANQAATDAKKTANWALYTGIAGVAIGLIAVFLATRKK